MGGKAAPPKTKQLPWHWGERSKTCPGVGTWPRRVGEPKQGHGAQPSPAALGLTSMPRPVTEDNRPLPDFIYGGKG